VQLVPVITTVAGNGTFAFSGDNGPATNASLSNPTGVTLDAFGNLYIADYANNRIRMVSPSGIITTVAGNGTQGYSGDNGPATSAELYYPTGVAADSYGNLYIADTNNSRIRQVSPNGIITTVAGDGVAGYSGDNAAATSAELSHPLSMSVDSFGNLYIADQLNNRVRMVTASTGIITTVAGNGTQGFSGDDGPATSAELTSPTSVVVDASGDLDIADSGNSRIRKVTTSTGVITTVAGNGTQAYSGDNVAATSAGMSAIGVTVDASGNIYIVDPSNFRIRMVNSSGIITTVAGNGTQGYSGDDGAANSAELNAPYSVALDASGNLYVADANNQRIRKISEVSSPVNETVTAFPTASVGSSATVQNMLIETTATETITSISAPVSQGGYQEFSVGAITGCIIGVSNPAGTICTIPVTFTPHYPGERRVPLILITDTGTYPIGLTGVGIGPQVAVIPGILSTVAGIGPSYAIPTGGGAAINTSLDGPFGVTVDSAGNLYIPANCYCVWKVTADTGIITRMAGTGVWGGPLGDGGPAIDAAFETSNVAVDSAGNLYVADSENSRIRMVAAGTGIITTVAGGGTNGLGDGGLATNASLSSPVDVAVDGAGNLFIDDYGDGLIRKVSAVTGIITSVAGNGTNGFSGDGGVATSASISATNVLVDTGGDIYINEYSNQRVRKVSAATGLISTVAGNGTPTFSGDGGPATIASLYSPRAIGLDSAGNLYIADATNSRIRKVSASTGIITTIAGNGAQLFAGDGGSATAGSFLYPQGLALDSAGNLFVAEAQSGRVREVNVSTGELGFTDTAVGSISVESPLSAAISNIGNGILAIAVPQSGTNPSVSNGYNLANGTTCPQLIVSSYAGTLASGADCLLSINFAPLVVGVNTGSLALTDNALNAAATQSISLNGTGDSIGTTTTLMSSPNPSSYGQPISISATVAPTSGLTAPSGTVQFNVDGSPMGSQVALTGGTAGFITSTLTPATHSITAAFSPTSGSPFTASNSTSLNQVVNQAVPSVSFTGSPASAPYESVFAVVATTNASTTAVITASGSCSIAGETVTITAPSGTCSLTATWAADNNYLAAWAAQSTTATKATPLITWSAPASITYGTALSGTQLDAAATYKGATVAGTFVYTPAKGAVLTAGTPTLSVTFTPSNAVDFANAGSSVTLQVTQAAPKITWAKPAALMYGTALSGTQLDASASVPGTFAYSPAVGTILTAGAKTLAVTFTPYDALDYANAAASVTITVNQANPAVTWATPAAITYGTALSSTQLNATASVPGSFAYSPAAGKVPAGGTQTLSATFTPTDTTDYTTAKASVALKITASRPTITWATPAAITYRTALTASQLDATATYNGSAVAGTFVYTPAKGTVLTAGPRTLSVTFTPSNTTDYAAPPITSVTLLVNQAAPIITWAKPAAIVYGTALSTTQLNATASVPGKFVYSPGLGAIPNAGTQSLSATFTATDATDYTTVGDTVTITVNQAASISKITSNSPNPSTVGQSVTVDFSVTGSGFPTGAVTVTSSTGESCSGTLSGDVGSCALTFTANGSPKLTATYPGDLNFKTSSSAKVTQTVNP
jgi:sugar lactone lactonase YvrE